MINTTSHYQQYESQKKPTALKSIGKGITTGIKSLIPVYNLYTIGDEFCKIETAKENLDNIKKGSLEYEEKNWLQKTGKGLGKVLLSSIPIIGTYTLGKTKNEKENLKKEIAGQDTKKAGVFKNYFTGLWEKIKLAIPFYNVYYIGKESLEATNIQNDTEKIYSEAASKNLKTIQSEYDTELNGVLNQVYALSDSGMIDDKTMVQIEKIAQADAKAIIKHKDSFKIDKTNNEVKGKLDSIYYDNNKGSIKGKVLYNEVINDMSVDVMPKVRLVSEDSKAFPLDTLCMGFSGALLEGLGGELNEKQDKYLNIINKNSKEFK